MTGALAGHAGKDVADDDRAAPDGEGETTGSRPYLRLIVPLVPLALGIAGCVNSYRLALGSLVQPGPGLWPFAASAALVVASAVLLLQRVRSRDDQVEPLTPAAWRVTVAVGLMALFAVAFVWIGLLATLFLVLVVWLRFLSRESWRGTLVYAVTVTVSFYVLFVVLLRIPFPGESLPAFLGGSL